VHQNISADKILLDHHLAPRLSVPGLHKLLADDVVFSALKASAAMGYLAPEYAATGRFTDKSDVFAFGVVVLQVLTGRRDVSQLKVGAAAVSDLGGLVDANLDAGGCCCVLHERDARSAADHGGRGSAAQQHPVSELQAAAEV
jgi:hypothetical protein